jgi:hypothetical protein
MNMSLATIAATLEGFAAEVVSDAVAEGKTFLAQTVDAAKQFAETELAAGYTDFLDLANKVGKRATQLVTDLMSDSSLSGLEKSNLAATQLVEHAATNGITIAEQDVTALIKNAYEAVKAKIASL